MSMVSGLRATCLCLATHEAWFSSRTEAEAAGTANATATLPAC